MTSTPTFKPSKYQVAIDQVYDTTDQNILVGAVAGSGKTTYLVGLMKRTFVPTLFLAFNKSIQQELHHKIGDRPNVDVLTLHSLGMRSLMKFFNTRLHVNENKAWTLMTEINTKQWKLKKKEFAKNGMVVSQLIDIYRMTLCTDIHSLQKQADILGIDYIL